MNAGATSASAAHAVALYDSGEDLRRRVLPFLRAGLAGGEAVVAIVSADAAAHLRDGMGSDHRAVEWRLPGISYHSLGPMFDGLRRYLAEHHEAGRAIRLIAENDTTSSPGRAAAYLRFEAASNDVMGRFGFPWVCLYDRRRHPAHVLEQVHQVHPHLLDAAGRTTISTGYVPPDDYLTTHPGPLSQVPPDPDVDVWVTTVEQLPAVRRSAAGTARAAGLAAEQGDDFELAAAEVLSNALRHGERPCRVRLWATPSHIVLRVDDQGPGDDIAAKGFHPPDPTLGRLGGMGVWMVRQLADVVHVHTGPAGTAVELQFPRL